VTFRSGLNKLFQKLEKQLLMLLKAFRDVVPIKEKSLQVVDLQASVTFNVIRAGFEPTTRSLEGCCSIQLSYRTIFQQSLVKLFKVQCQSELACKIKQILKL
jgi:hypothetical protein